MSIFDNSGTETCDKVTNERKRADNVRPLRKRLPFLTMFKPNPFADEAMSCLRRAFEVARDSNDMATVESLQREAMALVREFQIVGRPSGSSPPQSPELPDHPPAWWRDREPGTTPDKWIETYYLPFIGRGLTRSFFQRKGQDKAFYNGLLAWEQAGNTLPDHLHLPTKSELVDRELEAGGGVATVQDRARESMRVPEIREASRLYHNARRRLG